MQFNKFIIAASLVLAGFSAHAVNVVSNIDLIGDPLDGMTAGLSDQSGSTVNHTISGVFTDTFTFSFAGAASVDVWLNTSADLAVLGQQQIVFTSANLNGIELDLLPTRDRNGTRFRFAALAEGQTTGDFVLTVSGYAGLLGSTGENITASYSGGINAIATPVPEPESYALMLGGLAAIGFVARRRRPV